jgi:hypothetical protein
MGFVGLGTHSFGGVHGSKRLAARKRVLVLPGSRPLVLVRRYGIFKRSVVVSWPGAAVCQY